jgi:hypothetical protein
MPVRGQNETREKENLATAQGAANESIRVLMELGTGRVCSLGLLAFKDAPV